MFIIELMFYEKVYVAVYLKVSAEGVMKPVCVEWSDGTCYKIDKILDERNAPPEHTGGVLTRRYSVIINGKVRVVYFEKHSGRWFVEKAV